VPAELGNLAALDTLFLGGNQLTSVPKELGGLTALRWGGAGLPHVVPVLKLKGQGENLVPPYLYTRKRPPLSRVDRAWLQRLKL